jgi:hypothetical protein
MVYILFDKPLVFWFGIIAFISFSFQIYSGWQVHKGKYKLFKYHRLNAFILSTIVFIHLLLGLSLYL